LRLNARYRAAYEADETPQKAFASRDRHCDEEQKTVCVKYVEEKFFAEKISNNISENWVVITTRTTLSLFSFLSLILFGYRERVLDFFQPI
tara:strand:- start:78 stop:350 length:273 start_codon:yes stop_codon:yes gene_type:complete